MQVSGSDRTATKYVETFDGGQDPIPAVTAPLLALADFFLNASQFSIRLESRLEYIIGIDFAVIATRIVHCWDWRLVASEDE